VDVRVIVLLLAMPGCASSISQTPGCTEPDLAVLAASYATAIVEACPGYREPEDCPAFRDVEREYDARFERWTQCR
jgi:hypothetical protein